ncbi:MAG: phosphoglycerate dehydrogenase [Planctomycetia bacterium]|nr:phosphoglycerate dehydrogenase [Planctomycetia bacterium]
MPRILVTPFLLHGKPGPYRDVLEAGGCEIVYPTIDDAGLYGGQLYTQLGGIDGVLAGAEPYTREVLEGSKLRAIARMGVGYDAVDVAAATERGIVVTIAPGTNEHSVAEHALALLLGVFRGFPGRDREVRTGVWQRRPLWRLAGKTIGLVGLGRIGKAVVPRAQALGLSVIAYDPLPDRDFAARHDVRLCTLEELLGESHIVSLHLPCTPETIDLVNARTLAMMRPGAVLVNTARGGLVDEDALADALRTGRLAAAGLDVFKVEPLPLDSPLLKLDNVLLAPHMAGLDEESNEAMSRLAAECLAQLARGDWPQGCVVNAELRAGWKW